MDANEKRMPNMSRDPFRSEYIFLKVVSDLLKSSSMGICNGIMVMSFSILASSIDLNGYRKLKGMHIWIFEGHFVCPCALFFVMYSCSEVLRMAEE